MNAVALLVAASALGFGDSNYIPASIIVISGLADSAQVSLSNDGVTLLTGGNGQWALGITYGEPYDIRVGAQPPGQICSVNSGKGTVGDGAAVPINVDCHGAFSVGGTIVGLSAGESIEIEESRHRLRIGGNGKFAFTHGLIPGASYRVTINEQPERKSCEISGATGAMPPANVATVEIKCAATVGAPGTEQGEFEEFGSEQEAGIDGFQKLPSSIEKLTDKDCEDIGKPFPLSADSRLWVTVPTDVRCMGSGGGWMSVILEVAGQKPREVLSTSAVSGIKLDRTSSHQDLPDAIVEWGSAMRGPGAALYVFDGKEYKAISALKTGSFDDFTGVSVPADVRAVLGDYGADRGCTLSGGPITAGGYPNVALLVVSSCGDENEAFPVWVVMFTPTPHVILQDRSPDGIETGPKQFNGQPDICLGKCWHFDGKAYVAKAPNAWPPVLR
jgi:hypothetical protein